MAFIDLSNIYLASAMSRHWVRSCGHVLEEREIDKKVHEVRAKCSRRSTCQGSGYTLVHSNLTPRVSGKRLDYEVGREGGNSGCRTLCPKARRGDECCVFGEIHVVNVWLDQSRGPVSAQAGRTEDTHAENLNVH